MLQRFLYTPDGQVRPRRMWAAVIFTVGVAVLGSMLMVLTPLFAGHETFQTLWVVFSVFLLKFPLVAFLFWFIVRNRDWPFMAPKWSDEETGEILDYLLAEAERSLPLPDAPERLSYLQGEAWHVADRTGEHMKARAAEVALQIGRLQIRPDHIHQLRHGG